MGGINNPFFRIVAADSRSPADGRFIEKLGWYDPMRSEGEDLKMDLDRVAYWIKSGAQMTETAQSLINRAKRVQPTHTAVVNEVPAPIQAVSAEVAPEATPEATPAE